MPDFFDKETGHHRGPTSAEALILDIRRAYDNPGWTFDYGKVTIQWHGWRTPIDALYEFGVWTAIEYNGGDGYRAYSTTLGKVGMISRSNTFDAAAGGRVEMSLTPTDKLQLMYTAAEKLIEYIRATFNK